MSALLATAAAAFAAADPRYLLEARQAQALSLAVHIPLVCFGIAFPSLVLFAEWRFLRTGDPLLRTLAMRWSKVMLALFAVGVVTGTILSFELGLLWPGFMAAFGNVFGLGFALEGFSFFVEAIFIAIYVYGWNRLPPGLHFLAGLPVALAGITGSFFVIATNAWMQHPGGFAMHDGRAVDAEPWSALFGNAYLWHLWVHMYFAAYVVAGFLVAGVYAQGVLRGRAGRYERTALAIALSAASIAAPLQILIGDWAAREVAQAQPLKLAAMEGLATTTRGAPVHLLGWYDGQGVVYGIEIPRLLSLLAFHDPDATVQGLDTAAPEDRPPVNVVRFAFQTMVGIGSLLALLGSVFLAVRLRAKRLPRSRWFYRAVVLAGPLSVVALLAGWVTTEVGRQPWVVYGVMRTAEAVTGAQGIPIGYATLIAVYAALAGAVAWMLRRLGRVPLEVESASRGALVLVEIPVLLVLLGLAAYAVLAGADFGAGFWTLFSGGGRASHAATRDHARHAMGPVWEANHVWLIFVLVVCWTAYPLAFGSILSTLSLPLFVAAVGIILRGASYALRSQLDASPARSAVESIFAFSSILTPFALGCVAGAIASGRVPVGNAQGDPVASWLNATSVLIGVLLVATSSYLAAVYLAADARRLGEPALERDFRARALAAGLVAGALALAGPFVLRRDAPALFEGLTRGGGLAMVALSACAGLATLALVWRSRFGPARVTAALAVAAIVGGWAFAQHPRFLAGLTIEQAAAGRSTLLAVVVGAAAGAIVLVPSLALLFGLLLRGRLDVGMQDRPPRLGAPRPLVDGGRRGHLGRFALACLVVGAGLLVFGDSGRAHAAGVVSLCAFAASAFAVLAVPAEGADA